MAPAHHPPSRMPTAGRANWVANPRSPAFGSARLPEVSGRFGRDPSFASAGESASADGTEVERPDRRRARDDAGVLWRAGSGRAGRSSCAERRVRAAGPAWAGFSTAGGGIPTQKRRWRGSRPDQRLGRGRRTATRQQRRPPNAQPPPLRSVITAGATGWAELLGPREASRRHCACRYAASGSAVR